MRIDACVTCVFILFKLAACYLECVDHPCEECHFYFKTGHKCLVQGTHPFLFCDPHSNLIRQRKSSFLECNGSWLEMRECPPGSYYEDGEACVDPTIEPFMQGLSISGSGRVNDLCQYNTDCLGGMYCSGGVCTCLSTYIMREHYCYEKVNPNQPGCTYDIQCEAVWPGAKCRMDSSVGTCRCPEESHIARETRDGWVCVSLKDRSTEATVPLYFVCPLPEDAGFKLALNDPNPAVEVLPVGCTVGSTATIEPFTGLHGGGGCIWPSDGEYIGDIYDCIHTSPHVNLATKFPLSPYAPSADGVCCPSRALACIQPQMTGPNPTEPRWWYNSVTGNCQQFMWDPSASDAKYHSANNFRTMQHCESYCRDTCPRGPPQYFGEPNSIIERPVTSCSSSTACSGDFQCSPVGSQHLCCLTPSSICSARGGRPFDVVPRSSIYHAGFLVSTGRETVRFYYDTSTGRCQDFIYRGAGGNFNNFLSRHECELYCARLQCERGTPLRVGEQAQRCQSNGHCPSSYECRADQGVCCPRKQTICAQPLRIGDCTENVKRYWYNAKGRQCQMFEYTGCQGNDNNFETILDCQSFCKNAIPEPKCIQGQAYRNQFGDFVTCSSGVGCPSNYECYYDGEQWGCCPSKAFTCSLNADFGLQCGAGSTFRFFYNAQTRNCESFQYNGCDGNSNNFANRELCEQYCNVGGCPYGGTPLRDHSGMIAICATQEDCPASHACEQVVVGSGSVSRCCPTRAYMCGLPPQQGTQCGANFVTRYYFNIVTGQCISFQFGGCDGNYNNFLTVQQCRSFCHSSYCSAGDVAYVDQNSQMPIQCNEALSNSCPSGYTCIFNALVNSHVCCGASDYGVCPEGEKAFISTSDMSARECVINVDASCPANYLCRFSMQKNKYFCCASVSGKICPMGKFLHRDPQSFLPTRCTMGRTEQCSDGYSCQSYLPNAAQGFCCTDSSICPDDEEFVVDEHSQLPRACTMGSFVGCPKGYACKSLMSSMEGFCCRNELSVSSPTSDGCPPENYVFMRKGEVAACDPFNPANAPCPDGFTCQWSLANQKYQCCGSIPSPPPSRINDGCPNAQVAFMVRETIQVCTAGSSSCPIGYFCQFSTLNRQFQCCGVSGGCPAESVAFVGMSGEPERCVVGQSKCPVGFACRRSIAGPNICCTERHVSCSDEELAVDGECLKKSTPGSACLRSEQCTGGSVCQIGVCKCPTVSIGGVCREKIKCGREQIMYEGLCHNKAELGKPCIVAMQCPNQSTCVHGICECGALFTNLNGKCVSASARSKIVQARGGSSKCSNVNSKPLLAEDTGRVVFCSPKTKTCPLGYICQMNSKKTQYICCADSPESRQRQVCSNGQIPYLLNGEPQRCTKQRCPRGYECTYRNHDYVCCSSAGKPSSRVTSASAADDHCTHGNPLIYPSTRMPVICVLGNKGCPPGYACKKSASSEQYICCSARFQMNAYPGPPCGNYLVLVSRVVGGRIEEHCERSCPHLQVPIGGICYEMRTV